MRWRVENTVTCASMTIVVDESEAVTPFSNNHVIGVFHKLELNSFFDVITMKGVDSMLEGAQELQCQSAIGWYILHNKLTNTNIVA